MSQDYMLTIPNPEGNRLRMQQFVMWAMEQDSHKWVVGREVGKNGYEHLQCRIRVSEVTGEALARLQERLHTSTKGLLKYQSDKNYNLEYIFIKEKWRDAHVEKCSDTWTYERKGGDFLCSEDYDTYQNRWIMDKIHCRFGKETLDQQIWSNLVDTSNDRDIVVLYDDKGKHGKSWWAIHHWEIGHAHVVNPSGTSKALMQDVASKYATQGYRPWVIIDIPRSWKWTDDVYYLLEKIKDGLISDPRYNATDINIRGIKVAVCCNTPPDPKKLSDDRWFVWDVNTNWFYRGFERDGASS